MLPSENERHSFTIGRPEPTPRMIRFIGAEAVEYPGRNALSLFPMPGPWSENRMVFPLSMIVTITSEKRAWMKFSTISRISVYGIRPPWSWADW